MPKDAMGNEIVIGKRYGYSQRSNGQLSVTVGYAESFHESGKITLSGISIGSSYHKKDISPVTNSNRTKTAVMPNSLFPLDDSPISW